MFAMERQAVGRVKSPKSRPEAAERMVIWFRLNDNSPIALTLKVANLFQDLCSSHSHDGEQTGRVDPWRVSLLCIARQGQVGHVHLVPSRLAGWRVLFTHSLSYDVLLPAHLRPSCVVEGLCRVKKFMCCGCQVKSILCQIRVGVQ